MDIWIVFVILAVAVFLFVTEKLAADVVALLVLCALVLTGLVTPGEAFSGFSSPATLAVAGMLVMSAGLQRTGALDGIGRALVSWGKSENRLLLLVILLAGTISGFINNTAAVAVFLPMVIVAAAAAKVPASRLLIPLSFASQFGGVCTLIGTSTNLLVSDLSARAGLGAFGMFETSGLGLILFAAGTLYFFLAGRWLLPSRELPSGADLFELERYLTELRIMPESPLIGQTVVSAAISTKHDITVLEVFRNGESLENGITVHLAEGDILLVQAEASALMKFRTAATLEVEPEFKLKDHSFSGAAGDLMIEALVGPRSRLAGRTLAELDFRWQHRTIVLGIQRRGFTLRGKIARQRLLFGDRLLLLLPREALRHLRDRTDLIILGEKPDTSSPRGRSLVAVGITAAVVVLAAVGAVPIASGALAGGVAMILTGCLGKEDAHAAIDLRIIFLLAGLLPLGIAMEKSGAAALVAHHALELAGGTGTSPVMALAVIFGLTAILTECMSNNAAAVLLAPIAISTAERLGVDPRPFLVAVMVAASTSFSTPVGYQTNTMVYNAGGYRFRDFLRVGVPLNVLFWIIAVLVIPLLWPF